MAHQRLHADQIEPKRALAASLRAVPLEAPIRTAVRRRRQFLFCPDGVPFADYDKSLVPPVAKRLKSGVTNPAEAVTLQNQDENQFQGG